MLYDNLLILEGPTANAGTANRTGGWVDLMRGTTVQANNISGVDQLGPAGVGDKALYVYFNVSGSSGSPSTTFTVEAADDTSGTNLTTLGTTGAVTVDGEYAVRFDPIKRFVRAKSAWTAGVAPYTAAVGI